MKVEPEVRILFPMLLCHANDRVSIGGKVSGVGVIVELGYQGLGKVLYNRFQKMLRLVFNDIAAVRL